jgi:hypothetical protein
MNTRPRSDNDDRQVQSAITYADRFQLPVFPCAPKGKKPLTPNGFKDATTDLQQIQRWWSETPQANIGIPTGQPSGFDALDIDYRDGGKESLVDLERSYGPLPSTRITVTGGGEHRLFAHHDSIRNASGKMPGIDIRGEGGYVIAPPSLHASGKRYAWHEEGHINSVALAPWPPRLVAWLTEHLEGNKSPTAGDDSIPEGTRNSTLTSIAGRLRGQGYDEPDLLNQLLVQNNTRCRPPLPEEEVKRIARSVGRYPPNVRASNPKVKSTGSAPTADGFDLDALHCMADVEPASVDWLWQDRIPLGMLTSLEGNPGVGKSFLTHALAAAISNGRPLPLQDARPPADALLLTTEDAIAHTIKPRLEGLGANMERIHVYDESLPLDDQGVENLENLVKALRAQLVIIDPITAFLPVKMDINRANEVRSVLSSLSRLADRRRCAIVIIRHLTKSKASKAIYQGLGSIDFSAACRSVLLAGNDPDNEQHRALVQTKNNLGPIAEATGYRIDRSGNFRWTGPSPLTAQRILAAERDETALSAAQEFVIASLANGPKTANEIMDAAKRAGHSTATVKRAKTQAGVISNKNGYQGASNWTLPEDQIKEDHTQK